MLRVISQSNSAAAKSYYSRADYYNEGQELAGIWSGKGAERLGLKGLVEQKDFEALCDNLVPESANPLTSRKLSERRVLYDFNFHVPKSVSLALEITGDNSILEAFRASVDETMREAQAEMKVRVRAGGQDTDRVSGNMIYATFIHRTSRPSREDKLPDPHLHAHVTVFNASYDDVDKKWKAGQFGDLKRDAPYFQAAFHSRFAKRLTDLGYGITRTSKGWELSGVTPALGNKFSRRTQEIEQLAADLKITDPAQKDKLGATSRLGKVTASMDNLRAYWNGRLGEEEQKLLGAIKGQESKHSYSLGQAIGHAAAHLMEKEAVVSERKFLTEALRVGVGQVTLADLERESVRHGVLRTEWEGQKVVSTREVLAQEKEILDYARKGRGTRTPIYVDYQIKRGFLHKDQKRAVWHVLQSPDRVLMINGAAGTGKTTLTEEAVEALKESGVSVAMMAPTSFASRDVLREKFQDADTVAKFLDSKKFQEQARHGVIWVDEAGLLSIKDLHLLFRTAEQLDSRVVLMGDSKQHSSVNRGPSLKLLETYSGLPSIQVRDIQRQTGEYKEAVQSFTKGRTADGFERLDKLGWITELPDAERRQKIADEYLGYRNSGESVLIVSPTRREGETITQAVRDKLRERELLGEEREFTQLSSAYMSDAQRADALSFQAGDVLQFHRAAKGIQAGERITLKEGDAVPVDQAAKFQVFRQGTVKLAVGDTIRMTAPGKSLDGHRFSNGASYQIKGFAKNGDVVLNNNWTVAKDFGHWTHGYVSTSVSSQGKTVERVIIAQTEMSSPAANTAQFYVSASRGRKSVSIYTEDKQALREAVQKTDKRPSATEVFGREPRRLPSLGIRTAFMNRLRYHLNSRNNSIKFDRNREREQAALEY